MVTGVGTVAGAVMVYGAAKQGPWAWMWAWRRELPWFLLGLNNPLFTETILILVVLGMVGKPFFRD